MTLKKHALAERVGGETSTDIVFSWLVHLRWGAVACQILLVLAVAIAFDMEVPHSILTLIISFEGASNLFLGWLKKRERPIPEWLFGLIMLLDIALLTALLFFTGGPMNPFTFLYLVHVVLGAVLMRPRWSWSLAIFAILCYASFFYPTGGLLPGFSPGPSHLAPELCHDSGMHGLDPLTALHLQGMWVAFAVTVFFIVFFVGKIRTALDEHQQTLIKLREEKVRSDKLASLAALAAGAAHEFATPLSTIAVAASEMHHFLKRSQGPEDLLADAKLIRQQVGKCKEILYQMTADAGEPLGEPLEELPVATLLAETAALFRAETGKEAELVNEAGELRIRVPLRTVNRAVKGLLKNGLDAGSPESPLVLRCRKDERLLYLEVIDRGAGMDRETLAMACEPFFTRKEPGKGLGLGLYLARSVAQRLGGDVLLQSEPGRGTVATLSLALDQVECGAQNL